MSFSVFEITNLIVGKINEDQEFGKRPAKDVFDEIVKDIPGAPKFEEWVTRKGISDSMRRDRT